MLARLSLCFALLFSFQHGAHGKRHIHAPQPAIELPPCGELSGGTQVTDCYDPPVLRPHPPAEPVADVRHNPESGTHPPADPVAAVATQSGAHAQQWPEPLPPCNFPGGIPGWDCLDPPKTPFPPCDFHHQRAGIDCWWPVSPPPSKTTPLTSMSPTTSRTGVQSGSTDHSQQWPEPLPPCNFPGAIPGWDCFDPPKTPLPPCDFHHQRSGIDCWPHGHPPAHP